MRHGLLGGRRPLLGRGVIFGALAGMVSLAPGAAWAAGPAPAAPSRDAMTAPAEASVLADYAAEFRRHNVTLSQPFFEGRAPGTRGNELAAEYLEFTFRQIGLKPAFAEVAKGSDGAEVSIQNASYRQPFRVGGTTGTILKVQDERFSYEARGQRVTLSPRRDFNTLGYSGSGEVTGPLVFCGYSITKGPKGYSSYPKGTDLAGKIAVVLRFEPMDERGKSLWEKDSWSMAAAREPKIIAAAERGAAAVILVNAPGADDERVNTLDTADGSKPFGEPRKIPVVMMSIEAADALVKAADASHRSLMDLRRLADQEGGVVDLPGAKVALKTDIDRRAIVTDNVAGILEGAGSLADQYIVLGAHYDHVGYGYFGSRDRAPGKIHPGADDNASGTSAMLVLADRLKKAYAERPADEARRSILFIGFSAEESGLNGSKYYVKNPAAPKDRTYLMINLDMVGRMKNDQVEISGVGTGEGLSDFVKPYFDSSGLKIASKPGGGGPSDHASFNSARIPVMFFFTGLHEEYHSSKDVSDLINNEGAARVIDLAERLTMDLARRPEAMAYQSGRMSSMTPHQAGDLLQDSKSEDDSPGPAATRVRFGIAPGDYSGSEKGVLVGEVYPNWPAAEAGLRQGDLMTKWNGQAIDSVEAWMPLLSQGKVGDKVEIVYLRDGQEHTTTATLRARQSGAQ